ncbi:M13 family metallopeptidase [Nakamurella lactea]|uniref:M13 family metallopeptidase n=1 Tax=Nakamurella lactea TaxID=459515 RepID=UPI00048D4177|nr:M13-type metalloendopeptidase [Nakamurella lactea]
MTQTVTDPTGIDPDTRPQDDLYRHVNGGWFDATEIPADLPSTGAMIDLRLKSEQQIGELLTESAAAAESGAAAPGSPEQQIGAMYASFMDVDRVQELGVSPLADALRRIDAIADLPEFAALLGELERTGVSGAVRSYVDTDDRNSDRYVVNVMQGGLGLPDESYYRDDQFAGTREQYVAHIGRMLGLAGVPDPQTAAAAVMSLETTLAAGHWDAVACRDVIKTYNLTTADELAAAAPAFDWTAWITALGGTAGPGGTIAETVVRQPSYLPVLSDALQRLPLDDWKRWLSWHLVHAWAPHLSTEFVDENFDFYSKTLAGTQQQRERWKRGVALIEATLPEAAGKLYVERHFPPAAKHRMDELVANLLEAYRQSITALDWMGADTKERALAKLDKFTPKIGYPDSWRDYSSVVVDPTDLVGNIRRARAFETDRELAKIGGPVDRTEWFMSPQTVNAYYNPGTNEICFPAAILQPPMFDLAGSDAANYGAIGAVIGHEVGHGFDDQGAQYDGDGNLVNWWTDADRSAFTQRSEKLIAQFSGLHPLELPEHTVNGGLTVGENIGDLGGLTIALKAYQISRGTEEVTDADRQQVFIAWARAWRTKRRTELALQYLQVDPHSPPDLRANIAKNLDEFHAAFGTAQGDGMWLDPAERVHIW